MTRNKIAAAALLALCIGCAAQYPVYQPTYWNGQPLDAGQPAPFQPYQQPSPPVYAPPVPTAPTRPVPSPTVERHVGVGGGHWISKNID